MTQSYIVIFHNKTKTRKRLPLITITKQFIRNNNECPSSASSMVLKAGVDNLLKEDVEPENKCVQETTIEIERLSTADSLTVCCP